MPRIGITGHARLSGETVRLVYDALIDELRRFPGSEVVGITCLCPGADQLFAKAVIEVRGRYEVVVPAVDYRDRAVPPESVPIFDDLLKRAHKVSTLDYPTSREAFQAASDEMLRRSDLVVAIWDGSKSVRPGDTADVVRKAWRSGKTVRVLWPSGAERGDSDA